MIRESCLVQDLAAAGAIPTAVTSRGFDEDAVTAAYIAHLRGHAAGRAQAGGVHRETELLRAAQRRGRRNGAHRRRAECLERGRPKW